MQVNKQSSHGSYGSHAVPLLVMYSYQCTPYGKSKNISPETSGYWWVEKSSQTTKSSMVMETFTNTFSMDPYWDQSVWFNSGILQKNAWSIHPKWKTCYRMYQIKQNSHHLPTPFPHQNFPGELGLGSATESRKGGLGNGHLTSVTRAMMVLAQTDVRLVEVRIIG